MPTGRSGRGWTKLRRLRHRNSCASLLILFIVISKTRLIRIKDRVSGKFASVRQKPHKVLTTNQQRTLTPQGRHEPSSGCRQCSQHFRQNRLPQQQRHRDEWIRVDASPDREDRQTQAIESFENINVCKNARLKGTCARTGAE